MVFFIAIFFFNPQLMLVKFRFSGFRLLTKLFENEIVQKTQVILTKLFDLFSLYVIELRFFSFVEVNKMPLNFVD